MKHQGFTLLELSVVLVIIALMAGGIFVGRDLIKGAELQKIGSMPKKFEAAAGAFKLKYGTLPGDMPNATSVWTASSNCPRWNTVETIPYNVCNGNGNGIVETSNNNNQEQVWFWQHLTNAQMIEGQYSGIVPCCSWDTINDSAPDLPLARKAQSQFGPVYAGVINGGPGLATKFKFTLGSYQSGCYLCSPGFTSNEARSIDAKFDDGLPSSGDIMVGQTAMDLGWCASSVGGRYEYLNSDTIVYSAALVAWPGIQGCSLNFVGNF